MTTDILANDTPERDTKQSAPRQAATKAKARRAKKPAQRPEVTHEKALLRDNLGKEDGPAREREQPEELIRGAAADDLAEELGPRRKRGPRPPATPPPPSAFGEMRAGPLPPVSSSETRRQRLRARTRM